MTWSRWMQGIYGKFFDRNFDAAYFVGANYFWRELKNRQQLIF